MNDKWIFINKEYLDESRFSPVTNINFIKPEGGLWIAPYNENSKYSSGWEEFLINEIGSDTKGLKGTILSIKPDAKILTIDSLEDLVKVLENYEYKNNPIRFTKLLDFEKLSKDYDAIFLTEKGQYETRLSIPNLYGWDIECMLVMNFDILEEELIIEIK